MVGEFQGTWAQELLKNLILSFSGLGLGAALYVAGYDIHRAIKTTGHVRWLWASRALFAVSFVVIVGLLTEAIYGAPRPLPFEWRVILYTAAVIGSSLGGLGIAFESYRATKQNQNKGRFL